MSVKKMMVVVPMSRPRNVVNEVLQRKRGGAHGKTEKAQRKASRQKLLRDLDALLRG